MSRSTWTFEKIPPMGGATGEAFVNTLYGSGMKPAAVLAREAIQNSVDAWDSRSKDKARVVFRRQDLGGKPKARFVDALTLSPTFADRKGAVEYQSDHCIDSLEDLDKAMRLLYIEDYGTHGLHGHPHTSSSHFFKLLLSLGDSAKAREKDSSGGSYGYGKSVYSANSRIHTIVAYSVFRPEDDKSDHYARLMGCAYFNSHEFGKQSFTGRAWFGIPSANEAQVDPWNDQDAHRMAEKLGFALRGKAETGTSILIVDCAVDCDELRSSIEEWWWPRILDDSLDVELQEQGRSVAPPRPRSRSDLRPFIHCFDMATGRTMPSGKHDKRTELNRLKDRELGSLGLTVLDDRQLADEGLQNRLNRIALIRKPRMVVSYMEIGTLQLPCVGVFIAADSVDRSLKLSEPASHDKWDPDSARLLNLPEEERGPVKAILDRLRAQIRRFASEAVPPAPSQEIRLKLLERLLGNIFKPPMRDQVGDGAHPAGPVEIRFVRQPHPVADGGRLRSAGSFRLALADDGEKESVRVAVEVECFVVEDDTRISLEDPIPASISSDDLEPTAEKAAGRIICHLDRRSKPLFKFKTKPYPVDWTTRIRISVREVA